MLLASRNVFAWSFDGVAPNKLADVGERFAVPMNSILVCAVVGFLLMILQAYTTVPVFLANTSMMMEVVLCMVGLASMVTPYLRKEMFESWPDPAKKRILGVPLLTIFGAIMAFFAAWVAYSVANAPALGGFQFLSVAVNIVILLLAVPVFFAVIPAQKEKGHGFMLVFRRYRQSKSEAICWVGEPTLYVFN